MRMGPRPGSVLSPATLSEGDLAGWYKHRQCIDGCWYNARVISKTGSRSNTRVEVRFVGFPASQNESYVVTDEKLRVRLPAKELKAEQQGEHDGAKAGDGERVVGGSDILADKEGEHDQYEAAAPPRHNGVRPSSFRVNGRVGR